MSQTERETAATTEAAIGQWLIDRIRFYDQVDADAITLDAPLSELGLDSIYVMTLSGDIEDTYGIDVDPTLFAEVDTLGEVARELSARVSAT